MFNVVRGWMSVTPFYCLFRKSKRDIHHYDDDENDAGFFVLHSFLVIIPIFFAN